MSTGVDEEAVLDGLRTRADVEGRDGGTAGQDDTGAGTKATDGDEGTDVETESTDGVGVDTAVTGETEAGAVAGGTVETGVLDEVEAQGNTEGSTDMETGVLEDDAGTGTLELEWLQACVQFRAT